MAECECLAGCPFFNDMMENMPATANMIKEKFCIENNSECARHIIFKKLGKPVVPADLFPTQTDRATKILEASK